MTASTSFDYVPGLEPSSLAHLRFAVFALGDTGYENFCQCGRDLDGFFEKHVAERLLERVDNDVDFEDALQNWHRDVLVVLQEPVGAD
jgi:sulfite reductase (NADPH) flavoprotein alpha-component